MWRLEVKDPGQLAGPDLAERTEQTMTELAGSLGCQYDHCVDYDAVNGTPYYAWWVRVPQAEHQRSGPDGLPHAVTALHEHLRTLLPQALSDWHISPDDDLTTRVWADGAFKDCYADLIGPIEVALLGLRRDGAQKLDPTVYVWALEGEEAGASYAMQLCRNPDADSGWLVLSVGYLAGDMLWESPLGRRMRRFGVRPDAPVLTLPRPRQAMWVVQAETARLESKAPLTDGTGARHQWTGRNAHDLADRVARDLRKLWPHLA